MSLYLCIIINKPKRVVRPWSKELRRTISTKSREKTSYPFLDLPTTFWIFLPFFSFSYLFLEKKWKIESLHMWELWSFHSLQLSIWSYGPKLHFGLFQKKRPFFRFFHSLFQILILVFSGFDTRFWRFWYSFSDFFG